MPHTHTWEREEVRRFVFIRDLHARHPHEQISAAQIAPMYVHTYIGVWLRSFWASAATRR